MPEPASPSSPPAAAARAPRRARAIEERGAPLLEALIAAPSSPTRLGLPAGAAPVARTAAVLLVITIACAVGSARLGAPVGWSRLFDNLHWSIADVAAAWLAWLGVRDARVKGLDAEHAARRRFAFGFSAYAVGQMLWDLQAGLGWQPFPAPSDLFYLMLAPCCALGMMGFLRGRVSETQRLAALLDTLSLVIAIVAVALVAYLPRRGDTTPLALGVMLAYPALLFAAGCIGLMLIALLRVGRAFGPWMLTLQMVAQGGLWMKWNTLALDGALADGGVVNAAFSALTLLGGLAVATWRVDRFVGPRGERFYEGALRVLPLVVVVCVTFAVTLQDAIARLSPAARVACGAAAVLVIVLAAARQTLLLRDRDQLLEAQRQLRDREDELRELNQHLEQRVSERTREAEERNAELTAALQQLSAARHELVRSESLATLGALATGVAAEMSNALGDARLLAATLSTPDDGQRQLGEALEHAQRVIGGFRQFALDQASGRRRRFDALVTVREVLDVARLAHRQDPVSFVVNGEPGLEMDSYPGPLGQVLAQLVANAVSHGFADDREGTVEVRVWPSGREHVRITVRDDGVGIAPATLSQVSAPFHQAGAAAPGTGLGFTVVRNIVGGTLGGRIEIVSPPQAGTTVTVTLPRMAP